MNETKIESWERPQLAFESFKGDEEFLPSFFIGGLEVRRKLKKVTGYKGRTNLPTDEFGYLVLKQSLDSKHSIECVEWHEKLETAVVEEFNRSEMIAGIYYKPKHFFCEEDDSPEVFLWKNEAVTEEVPFYCHLAPEFFGSSGLVLPMV